jgi:eukaryotic-like serine/threonine-protein kinase
MLYFQLAAEILAYVFEVDGALTAVKGAVDAGLLDLGWMDRCPVLDVARKDPRFASLRSEVEARAARARSALREA